MSVNREPFAYAMTPVGGSYRGKVGCRDIRCTTKGDPDQCYGWHCILCDGPANCQGHCSNPDCPHPDEGS
jgi:hypothetical protein